VQTSDRRQRRRFNVTLNLHYSALPNGAPPIRGVGTTENISSSGLLFRCSDDALRAGAPVILHLMWPNSAQNVGDIRLWISGYIVRVTPPNIAIAISTHDFRRGDGERPSDTTLRVRNPGRRPLVLVVDTDDVYRVVMTALLPYKYPVMPVDVDVARYLLGTDRSNVGLLITSRLEELEDCSVRVPIVYTGPKRAQYPFENVVAVPKPLKYRLLRPVLVSVLLKSDQPAAAAY
jgi:hypothetical protein